MTAHQPVPDTIDPASRDEFVTFTILCQPASGLNLEEFRRQLTPASVERLLPADATRARVVTQLEGLGFEVFQIPGPLVFARGRVHQFHDTFGGELVRLTREISRNGRRRRTVTQVVLRPGTEAASVHRIEGALLVTIAEPPQLAALPAPPPGGTATGDYCLRLPNGVAWITKASSLHRRFTPAGNLATGRGVTVAVIDSGFARHPFFDKYPYLIERIAAPDVDSNPDVDEYGHGTPVLANLVSCAPDAYVYAIKHGQMHLAFGLAMSLPNVRVISVSWGFNLAGTLPDWMVILRFQILVAVALLGIAVVVSSGNDEGESSPANLPEVISVGGVSVSRSEVEAWDGSSSFESAFFRGRSVPDLCGVASLIRQPVPPEDAGGKFTWECSTGGTSCAAPQVAGIAALLIQKNPALTPQAVRDALVLNGTDVTAGHAFPSKHEATAGPDLATGGGFVNALKAWLSV